MTASALDWYAARAAGIVAYVLLTGVVLVGVTLAGKVQVPRWPKFAVTDVHRFGSLLVGAFLSIHVLTIAIDSYTPFSLTQLLVPLTSSYRPAWVAVGIVAAELLVALAVANKLRSRLPYRLWRRLHYLTFLVWAGATAHALGAGTDTRTVWLLPLYLACVSSVFAALAWRLTRSRVTDLTLRRLAGAAALAGVALVAGLAAAPHGSSARAPSTTSPRAISESFRGSISQQAGASGVLVSIAAHGTGRRPVLLRLDLVSLDGQSIADTALQFKDMKSGSLCRGTVTSFQATRFSGTCSFPGGSIRTLSASWQMTADRQLAGTLDLHA